MAANWSLFVLALALCLLDFGVALNAIESKEMIDQAAMKCRSGTTVTKELLTHLLTDKDSSDPEYSIKCYFKCFLEELGFMKKDGSIELDANHGHFADCLKSAMDDDLCDRAYHFVRCIHLQHPDMPVV